MKPHMNLFGHPERLNEILDQFITTLQHNNLLPNKLSHDQVHALREQVLKVLLNAKEQGLTFDLSLMLKPNDPVVEQEAQFNLFNLLYLTITSECLKQNDFKGLFGKSNDPKDQALIDQLDEILRKLKNAKKPEEAEELFNKAIQLCDELKKRPGLSPTLKIQVELARMMAHQMRHEVYLAHDAEHSLKPHPEMKKNEEEIEFSMYLRNLYGGIDPRFGGAASVVVVDVSNAMDYGSSNAGQDNDYSKVAEANRYDFKSDGSGRENTILQNLISKGAEPIIEALQENGLLTPVPTPGNG